MSPLETILAVYLSGLFLVLFAGAIYGAFGNEDQQRIAARAIFLSPTWPLVAFAAIPMALRKLWEIADWKGNK